MTSDVVEEKSTSYSTFNFDEPAYPIIISVPHAGRDYPQAVFDNLAVAPHHLLRLEDRLADRLAGPSIVGGIPTMIAHRPRTWIDLNRNVSEIDFATIDGKQPQNFGQPSRKVRGGLGLVPSRLNGVGSLWRKKWQWEDVQARIEQDHAPYHQKLASALQRIRNKFGTAILIDLHSMPSLVRDSGEPANIVIGDRFGRSANTIYSELSFSFFERLGKRPQLNHPYPGGYLLERHGQPNEKIHAIQLEIDRGCYLDKLHQEPGPSLPEMAESIKQLAMLLSDQIDNRISLEAAE